MKVAAFIQLFMVTSLAGLGDDAYIDRIVGAIHESPLRESHANVVKGELRTGQSCH